MQTNDTIRSALLDIYNERGRLDPHDVVDVARDDGHPLHACFEWDAESAAEKYLIHQARQLIRRVNIRREITGKNGRVRVVQVRAFHNALTVDEDGEVSNSYYPHEVVAVTPSLRDVVLDQMRREWQTLRTKWQAHSDDFDRMVLADLEAAS